MKFYTFALWKAYFDKGYGLLSLPKYILFLVGFGDIITSKGNTKNVLIWGSVFFIFCFFLGWLWYKYRITDAENEVQNQFNPLAYQLRDKLAIEKNI